MERRNRCIIRIPYAGKTVHAFVFILSEVTLNQIRHFNNFNDQQNEEWEVMQEFTVLFKGEQFMMQLICMFIRYPGYYFFIKELEEKSCIIGKLKTPDGIIFWNSGLCQEDAQDLVMLIEQQTGLVLPKKQQ